MKFGKQIQRQQLDLPEYASSFLNYKALKRLIKQLSATPVIPAQGPSDARGIVDPKEALRANKEVFFFRLVRMITSSHTFACLLVARSGKLKRSMPSTYRKRLSFPCGSKRYSTRNE